MKLSTVLFLFFLFTLNLSAQNTTVLGRVVCDGVAVSNVEIFNLKNKQFIKTNEKGLFSLEANETDDLLFYAKNYIQLKVKLKKEHFNLRYEFQLIRKSVVLDEVEIISAPKIKLDLSYEALSKYKIEKEQSRPQPIGVYTEQITNGADLVEIGRKIVSLFSNNEKKKKVMQIQFKDYVKNNFSNDFFINSLNLKED